VIVYFIFYLINFTCFSPPDFLCPFYQFFIFNNWKKHIFCCSRLVGNGPFPAYGPPSGTYYCEDNQLVIVGSDFGDNWQW